MSGLMDLIKFSSALKRKQKVADCVKALKDKLSEIPDLAEFRQSDELVEIVCCVVENLLAKKAKKYKINKKDVVFEVYKELFHKQPLTEAEKEVLSKRIDYLHEKGLIHSVAFLEWAGKGIVQWLLKKIG
jgi:hypothetical protein